MSDEQYARLLEERRIALQVKEVRAMENEDYMKQYGRPKYEPGYYETLPDDPVITFGD